MARPAFVAHVRTRRFNFTEVRPHFINPCCFGEDFAAWLADEIAPLAGQGYEISLPIQEDYGWGLWVSRARARVWIALSSMQDGGEVGAAPADPSAQGEWMVSVALDHGLNPLRALLGRGDAALQGEVVEAVRGALERAPDITLSPLEDA